MRIVEYIRLLLRHRENPLYVKYLKDKKVLDIGCGAGKFLKRCPDHFQGVDIDAGLVEICRQQNLQAQCCSALELPFEANTFEAVHAAQLIEHFAPTEAASFLKEVQRVLRPQGVLYLTTPGVRNVWNTFSHIRPYPPAAFLKFLHRDTENYIREEPVGLSFEGAWGERFYSSNRLLMPILRILDLLLPPSDPLGWTIILKKI